MAILVLLATAARARVVTAYLRTYAQGLSGTALLVATLHCCTLLGSSGIAFAALGVVLLRATRHFARCLTHLRLCRLLLLLLIGLLHRNLTCPRISIAIALLFIVLSIVLKRLNDSSL